MPKGRPAPPQTLAFDVTRMRERLYSSVRIPEDLFQRAIDELRDQLDAKETKFFTKDGMVVEEREVKALAIRQGAIDKVFSAMDVYAKPQEKHQATPTVSLIIDPVTGVVRLVVGSPQNVEPLPPAPNGASTILEHSRSEGQNALAEQSSLRGDEESEADEAPRIIKYHPGTKLPKNVYDALFGEE